MFFNWSGLCPAHTGSTCGLLHADRWADSEGTSLVKGENRRVVTASASAVLNVDERLEA